MPNADFFLCLSKDSFSDKNCYFLVKKNQCLMRLISKRFYCNAIHYYKHANLFLVMSVKPEMTDLFIIKRQRNGGGSLFMGIGEGHPIG